MIFIVHDKKSVVEVLDIVTQKSIPFSKKDTIQEILFDIAKNESIEFIGWCHKTLTNQINKTKLKSIFHQHNTIQSFSTSNEFVLSEELGYVDQSNFLNVNFEDKYPTWLMSSDIGATSTELLNELTNVPTQISFDLFLNIVAKSLIASGVFCYSNPELLNNNNTSIPVSNVSNSELYNFINSFYKKSWTYLLFLNLAINQNKINFFSFFKGVYFTSNYRTVKLYKEISMKSSKPKMSKEDFTVDVLIPTLKRKKYLKDVLLDLSKQTILPKKVIIVEQDPDINATSELDYLNDKWPFEIEHSFIHQLGACNARNIALDKVTNNWVFFADDDIRFEDNLFEKVYQQINKLGVDTCVISCPQKGEIFFSTCLF